MDSPKAFSETSDFIRLFGITPSKYETFFGCVNVGTSLVTAALQDHNTKTAAVSALLGEDLTQSSEDISDDSSSSSSDNANQNGIGSASPVESDSETHDNDPQVSHPQVSRPSRAVRALRRQNEASQTVPPAHLIEKSRLLSAKQRRKLRLPPRKLEAYELRVEQMLQKDNLARMYFNTKVEEELEKIESTLRAQTQQHRVFAHEFMSYTRFMKERLTLLDREKKDGSAPGIYRTKEGALVFTPPGFNKVFIQQDK